MDWKWVFSECCEKWVAQASLPVTHVERGTFTVRILESLQRMSMKRTAAPITRRKNRSDFRSDAQTSAAHQERVSPALNDRIFISDERHESNWNGLHGTGSRPHEAACVPPFLCLESQRAWRCSMIVATGRPESNKVSGNTSHRLLALQVLVHYGEVKAPCRDELS